MSKGYILNLCTPTQDVLKKSIFPKCFPTGWKGADEVVWTPSTPDKPSSQPSTEWIHLLWAFLKVPKIATQIVLVFMKPQVRKIEHGRRTL